MAIRFRCEHCNQLMSIASRQAGALVACPACAREVVVPREDQPVPPAAPSPLPLESPAASPPDQRELVSSKASSGGALEADTGDAPPFRLRRRSSEIGEMDLTPMVDVTFLLLIFFMVTTSFSLQKSIAVPPPDPDQEGAAQSIQKPEDLQENSVIVKIDENNAITVDFEPVADPARLVELLLSKQRTEQKNDLVIDADDRATHGTVVFVHDAAVEANFQHIRLAVRAAPSD